MWGEVIGVDSTLPRPTQAQGQSCWDEVPDPTLWTPPEGHVCQKQREAERAGSAGRLAFRESFSGANIVGVKVGWGVVLIPGMRLPGGPLRPERSRCSS